MNYVNYLLENDDALAAYLNEWEKNYQSAEDWYRNTYLNQGDAEDVVE